MIIQKKKKNYIKNLNWGQKRGMVKGGEKRRVTGGEKWEGLREGEMGSIKKEERDDIKGCVWERVKR